MLQYFEVILPAESWEIVGEEFMHWERADTSLVSVCDAVKVSVYTWLGSLL